MDALPQRRLHLCLVALLCLSGVARAQSGGACIQMSGGVSEMVALSSHAGANVSAYGVRVTSSHKPDRSLSITLSGTTRELTRVSIPFQIRSNTGYTLLATAKADGSDLSGLAVVDARPTGNLVAADAAALSVSSLFDAGTDAGELIPADRSRRPNLSSPLELLSGPRVSKGGTQGSPGNALEVTLSLVVAPRAGNQVWTIELLLTAAAGTHALSNPPR
jgi:hypothetical protein